MKTLLSGTSVEIENKARLEAVVDLALEVLLSRDADAGWQNFGILGRLRDCGGVLPEGQASSLSVWKKGWLLGNWKPKHRQALSLLEKLSETNRQAGLIHRAYHNRTTITEDPTTGRRTETRWTTERICQELELPPNQFRLRVHRGYEKLGKELEAASNSTA